MNRDTHTIPLFAGDFPPAQQQPTSQALPAQWPTAKRESFTWWCQNGNKEMCAAVLWRNFDFTQASARALVNSLSVSAGGTAA